METPPMHVVLVEPEIPPNTGNIARLCAGFDVELHLVGPLGFSLEDRYLRRAGLDYWPKVRLTVWPDWKRFLEGRPAGRLVMSSARQGEPCCEFSFQPGDLLVLGPETRGLPSEVMASSELRIRIPITDNIRSLNLSTAAGIMLYEALRQVRWRSA
jgi:tRNA (cytidine/uridine-2'-O-)-methyltransferase